MYISQQIYYMDKENEATEIDVVPFIFFVYYITKQTFFQLKNNTEGEKNKIKEKV